MLQTAFIVSFIVWFIHACYWQGMILSKLSESMSVLPLWLRKPLYECIICMTPYYGSIVLLVMWWFNCFNGMTFGDAVIIVACASGINTVASLFIPVQGHDEPA